MEEPRMFIDGEWVKGKKTLPVVNPTTGATMANVPAAGADDIDRAAKAARKAFDEGPWKTT
ncbi:MAG TPA: aldehyde dehydrogenase family protein, partial [Myxococcota bacterium]|nr:aldehyde dehydrogenase family protein [Myxococcota bacterium]